MKKDEINSKLRQLVRDVISLTEADRAFVKAVYEAFTSLVAGKCLQIGSYPRFTAIRPLHDLDILYLLGPWVESRHDPYHMLQALQRKIRDDFQNPTEYNLQVALQTHSVTVSFRQDGSEVFSVDIVPAYSHGKNEFEQDMYRVPELLRMSRGESRTALYDQLASENKAMQWITSDPRGYIEKAKQVNQSNPDFRRTVKFLKAWKNACNSLADDFPLKSFHIEQLITRFFIENPTESVFDSVFDFCVSLPETILEPQIADRADASRYIDAYLADLSAEQRDMVGQARDHLLKSFEELSEDDPIGELLDVRFYQRASASEQFLFDKRIPMLTDPQYGFRISGHVLERAGGFRRFVLDEDGLIPIDRKIRFRIKGTPPAVEMFKWKVRNDDRSPNPRGDITDHQTRNDPEYSKYEGDHYVECYAILENTCVAKARQRVKLEKH